MVSADDTLLLDVRAIKDGGVPLARIVEHLSLEVVTTAGVDLGTRRIRTADLNRPGLQWAGYSEHFPGDRIQMLGRAEAGYLATLSEEQRLERLAQYLGQGVPAVVICHGLEVSPLAIEFSERFGVPMLRSQLPTTQVTGDLNRFLTLELAPRELLHAGLVDVAGEGVLILGRSGIGKSETALELLRRGHRLVADDTVDVRRPAPGELIGRAPGRMRHFMEIKGIGIVNLRRMYGVGAVKDTGVITMVVSLVPAEPEGGQAPAPATTDILGVEVPTITIPVRPGRNTAVLIEASAMSVRARRLAAPAEGLAPGALSELYGRLG